MITDEELIRKAKIYIKDEPPGYYKNTIYNTLGWVSGGNRLARWAHTLLCEFCISCELRDAEYFNSFGNKRT